MNEMKSIKKTIYLVAITLVIAGLVLSSAASTPISKPETSSVKVIKTDKVAQKLAVPTKQMSSSLQQMASTLASTPAIEAEGDQIHPAFGRTITGVHMTAYKDVDFGQMIWTFSTDDGTSYDPGVYYEIGGDYPSIKLWQGTTMFGTHVTDFNDANGGAPYLFSCTNPADSLTYSLLSWDFSTMGWHDMMDADIGVDSSQLAHEWGVSAYVMSTTYASGGHNGYTNGPTILYADPADPNQGYISWYWVNNTAHTDGEIDHSTITSYSVYDQDENLSGNFKLLVRVMDFEDPVNGADNLYEIVGAGSLTYPAIACQNDNLVLLAQTNEAGNSDIVCYYSTEGINSLQTSFVVSSAAEELYPDVRHVDGTTFVCTFVKEDKLYMSTSTDGGATWGVAEEIDTCISEYKTADITDAGAQGMFEKSNGADIDLYLTTLAGAPDVPIIKVKSIAGGLGISAVIKNEGTAAGTNVTWTIHVTGGILGLINKTKSDTITSLAVGEELTIKSGILFGFGAITITVTADLDTMTASGTQLIIFSKV